MSFAQNVQLQTLVQIGCLGLMLEELEDGEKKKKKKRLWVRDWVGRRPNEVPIFREIHSEDEEKFFSDFRFYPRDFEKLLQR